MSSVSPANLFIYNLTSAEARKLFRLTPKQRKVVRFLLQFELAYDTDLWQFSLRTVNSLIRRGIIEYDHVDGIFDLSDAAYSYFRGSSLDEWSDTYSSGQAVAS